MGCPSKSHQRRLHHRQRGDRALRAGGGGRRRRASRELLTVVVIGGGFTASSRGHLLRTSSRMSALLSPDPACGASTGAAQGGDRILPELQHESSRAYALRSSPAGRRRPLGASGAGSDRRVRHASLGERRAVRAADRDLGTTRFLRRPVRLPIERGRVRTTPDMRVEGQERPLGHRRLCADSRTHTMGRSVPDRPVRASTGAAAGPKSPRSLRPRAARSLRYRRKDSSRPSDSGRGWRRSTGVRFSGFPAWFLWRGCTSPRCRRSPARWGWPSTGRWTRCSPPIPSGSLANELGRIRRSISRR